MAIFSPQNSDIRSRIFVKNRYRSAGYITVFLFGFILIVLDYHYHATAPIRRAVNLVLSPIQYIVDYPHRITHWAHSLVSTRNALINENMQLHTQQTLLEAQLQKLLVLQNENIELKELLSASSSANTRAMAAEILAVDTTRARQLLVLNKGKREGVYVGQPVLDAKGVTGQIIDVGLRTSTILLISDAKSAVPVRNNRTGERAILVGTNNISELSLVNLPKSSSIIKGDLLVTSGLGRRYPEGYPVGRVDDIQINQGDDFIKVSVRPVALLNRSRLVLLIWPENDHEELTKQIDERIKVADESN